MTTEAPGQTPSSPGEPAEMFGPYRLERRIGRGGMGEVFRAFDTSRQRMVALKRLHGGLADDSEYQHRFRRESHTAARLASPHVIPIHDFGTIDGRLYLDMRLVSGTDLGEEIRRRGRLEPVRVVEIVVQVAEALDEAHDDGLIHRDVKPSNVLISQHRGRDFAYLVDFGIVRTVDYGPLTETGVTVGTLAYMAPELFRGEEADGRADVYALGCLLFEAITGRPPFLSEGAAALMFEHLTKAPPRLTDVILGAPEALEPVLATAMAKDPGQRYATAGDLAAAAADAVGESRTGPASAPMPVAETARTAPGPIPPSVPGPRRPSRPTPAAPGPPGRPVHYTPTPDHGVVTEPGRFPPTAPGAPVGPGVPGVHWPGGAVPVQPQTRGRGKAVAAVVAAACALLLLAVLGVVLLTAGAGEGTPTSASPPVAGAPTIGAGQLALTQVFPDATGPGCRPSTPEDRLTTSGGVNVSEAYICAYPNVAPNATVIFSRWPDTAGALQWYRDTEALGPRMDQYVTWSTRDGASQGAVYTVQRDGMVYSTGLYDGLAYSWEIRTSTLDQSWGVWNQMHLRPHQEIGG